MSKGSVRSLSSVEGMGSAGRASGQEGSLWERTNGSDGECLVPQDPLGERPELIGGDPFDPGNDLIQLMVALEVDLHLGKTGHPTAGALQSEEQVAFELILRLLEINGIDRFIPETGAFGSDQVHDLARGFWTRPRVDDQEAAVAVRGLIGVNRIGEATFLADLL